MAFSSDSRYMVKSLKGYAPVPLGPIVCFSACPLVACVPLHPHPFLPPPMLSSCGLLFFVLLVVACHVALVAL